MKVAFTILSIVPLLVLPGPIKMLIDHVIGDMPLAGHIASYPFIARPVLRLLVGCSPEEILLFTVAAQAVMLLLIGQIGSDGGERDRTDAWLSAGVDNATSSENAANAGFSFVGGLYGMVEFRWTLRLTQDLNHAFRSRLFERIQSLPLAHLDDGRIGDAVYRLMYDTPSITRTCYRSCSSPRRHRSVSRSTRTRSGTASTCRSSPSTRWGSALITLAATWPFSRSCAGAALRSRAAGSTATSSLEEGVSNILAVQSLGGEARERERFDRESSTSFARYRGVVLLAMSRRCARSCRACWSCAARSSRSSDS